MEKIYLENISTNDIGREATVMLGEQPSLIGKIENVTPEDVTIKCVVTDSATGIKYNATVTVYKENPNTIFSMTVDEKILPSAGQN